MKIKKILSQYRRDFYADYECEHCHFIVKEQYGYDDANFHKNVIPNMKCPVCGKISPENYQPRAPKYAADMVV